MPKQTMLQRLQVCAIVICKCVCVCVRRWWCVNVWWVWRKIDQWWERARARWYVVLVIGFEPKKSQHICDAGCSIIILLIDRHTWQVEVSAAAAAVCPTTSTHINKPFQLIRSCCVTTFYLCSFEALVSVCLFVCWFLLGKRRTTPFKPCSWVLCALWRRL